MPQMLMMNEELKNEKKSKGFIRIAKSNCKNTIIIGKKEED